MDIQAMNLSFVVVLDIRKYLIPCAWILRFVNALEVHGHPIDNLYLPIILRVVGSGFGVQ
jgi:hypothetical protein